ncbi:N-acetylmuramoyl-L-alanine amidase [bacterium]|nr:N-acetylmuramoyl-L-alanine amidase [bacterium]
MNSRCFGKIQHSGHYRLLVFLGFVLLGASLCTNALARNDYLTLNYPGRNMISKIPIHHIHGIDYLRLVDIAGFFNSDVQSYVMSQRYQIDVFGQPALFQIDQKYFFIEQSLVHGKEPVTLVKGHVYVPLESVQLMLKSSSSFVVQWNEKNTTLTLLARSSKTGGQDDYLVQEPVDPKEVHSTIVPAGRKVRSITIDPGHGGKDSGAIGPSGLKEKDIVLTISKLLRDQLKRKYGLEVFLTRETDIFLPLAERTATANNNKSDLFLSIHTNSGRRKNTTGFEVYYLNKQPSDEGARETANLENLDWDESRLATTDLDSDLQSILWDLIQNKYLLESSVLAEKILTAHEFVFKTRSRGVKQAPFYVLVGADMPAVLVEIDFISNPVQEKKLTDGAHLNLIVDALVRGIEDFIKHYEKILGADLIGSTGNK